MAAGPFRYPFDIQSTLEPWRHELGSSFGDVVAHLSDRDRALEDVLQNWLSQYPARAYMNASPIVAPGLTTLALDTLTYDESKLFNLVNHTYVAPVDGLYHVNFQIDGQLNNNPQYFRASLLVNGTYASQGTALTIRGGTGGDQMSSHGSDEVNIKRGDALSVAIDQTGAANNIQMNGTVFYRNFLSVYRVRPRIS